MKKKQGTNDDPVFIDDEEEELPVAKKSRPNPSSSGGSKRARPSANSVSSRWTQPPEARNNDSGSRYLASPAMRPMASSASPVVEVPPTSAETLEEQDLEYALMLSRETQQQEARDADKRRAEDRAETLRNYVHQCERHFEALAADSSEAAILVQLRLPDGSRISLPFRETRTLQDLQMVAVALVSKSTLGTSEAEAWAASPAVRLLSDFPRVSLLQEYSPNVQLASFLPKRALVIVEQDFGSVSFGENVS